MSFQEKNILIKIINLLDHYLAMDLLPQLFTTIKMALNPHIEEQAIFLTVKKI